MFTRGQFNLNAKISITRICSKTKYFVLSPYFQGAMSKYVNKHGHLMRAGDYIKQAQICTMSDLLHTGPTFNTLRPIENRRHFADDIFKCIFVNDNWWIPIKILLKFVPKGPINNNPALVQIMAWRRPGDKPLSEAMLVCLLTHICVTRPQWVKRFQLLKIHMEPTWSTTNKLLLAEYVCYYSAIVYHLRFQMEKQQKRRL